MTRCRHPARPGLERRNATVATCVTHGEGGSTTGTRDIETSCRSRMYPEYRVVAMYCPVRCIPRENADESAFKGDISSRDHRPCQLPPQFRCRYAICAGVISRRRQQRETITLGGALKYEKCDSTALIRRWESYLYWRYEIRFR